MFFKKYHCILQHDIKDCAPACLATIAKHHGKNISIGNLRSYAKTDIAGTNALGIVTAAKKIGFDSKVVSGSKEDLHNKIPLPCIANTKLNGISHYVVIHKIDKNFLLLADPAKGLVKIPFDEFAEQWTSVLILLTQTQEFKSNDSEKGVFSRYRNLVVPHKNLFINITLASFLTALFGVVSSLSFKILIDEIIPYSMHNSLIVISVAIIIINLFSVLIQFFRSHMMIHLSRKIDIPLVLGYYNHVLELPYSFFSSRKTGEIISRFNDASKIRTALTSVTLSIMLDSFMALFGAVILFFINKALFGIAVTMLIFYGLTVMIFNKPYRKMNRTQMEENSELSSYLFESLNCIETIKVFNSVEDAQWKTEEKYIRLLKTNYRIGLLTNFRNSFTKLISSLGSNLIMWVGAYSIITGEMTIGELLVFNSLLAYFIDPVKNLINLQPVLQTAIVASERLGEVLDIEIEDMETNKNCISLSEIRGDVEFRNVSFRYGLRKKVINDLTFSIEAGSHIGIIGESGSGKTTIAKLLLKLYDVTDGKILLDGNNLIDISTDLIRERIALVSQNTFLFSGTLYENLTYGSPSAEFSHVVQICKLIQFDDFINTLPNRYNSNLEENGKNLSGGQRQKIAIVRALIKNPSILIFDEATSNMDIKSELALNAIVDKMKSKLTVITIAHKLSRTIGCDNILMLENGSLIEAGTHGELINLGKTYYRLWCDQNGLQEQYERKSKIEECN